MFRQLQNIDSAFRHIRLFTIVFLGCNVLLCSYVLYSSNRQSALLQSKIYVLSNSKLLEANAIDRKERLPVEVRDHVNSFHRLFFNLEPDEQLIRSQLLKALYLSDNSARIQFNDLTSNGYYSGIVSANISQRLTTDSIQVDLDRSPWQVRFYGKLSIIRATSTVIRSLITQADVRDLSAVSDNNPHGFLIEHWRIIENKDLNIQPR